MPGLSDPGYRLVRASAAEGIEVRVVPGPSAVLSGLVVSGLPTDRFVFEGFLPRRAGERRMRLRGLANDRRTVVLFESPHRVAALLRDVLVELGDRRVAIARELTKLHEEVIRGRTSEVLAGLPDVDLKGEVVVVSRAAAGRRSSTRTSWWGRPGRSCGRGCESATPPPRWPGSAGASANTIYRALLEGHGAEGSSPTT